MKWEDLQVYKPLKKEELKSVHKDFIKIIAENLSQYGFQPVGRKLIKQSHDLFHIIHIDTRGRWSVSDNFKTEISIASIYDTDTFIKNQELTGTKKLEDLIPQIRNHYRITQEYQLLADFLTRKLVEDVLPYFGKYQSSGDILLKRQNFKMDKLTELTERNENLILFCALSNHNESNSSEILDKRITEIKKNYPTSPELPEQEVLRDKIKAQDWINIDEQLRENKTAIFKKLKLHQP
ncbi:MAG: hypothetical protein JWO44_674 [Bacteroidetes bacterium]|nr:hypothetical protein [Bacteroidota bacterium]